MVNIIISFFKILLTDLLSYLKQSYSLAKLQAKYPSCKFYSGVKLYQSTFGSFNVIFQNTGVIYSSIGSHTYIQKNSMISNAEIGKFCSVAANVTIGPGIHDMNKVTTHPALIQMSTPLQKVFAKQDNILSFSKVFIGNDVWIGEKVIIIDGIKIGNGAVIAAGAVVVKNVAPYSVVGGVPAKLIKYRFDEETIKTLEESKWWDFSDEWFNENSDLMLDVKKFKIWFKQKNII